MNQLLREENMETVGLTMVWNTINGLKPKNVHIKKNPQGNQCAHSTLAKESFNMCKQLAIRYGTLYPKQDDPPMPPPLRLTEIIDDDDDLTLEESTTTAATPINDTNNTDLPPEFDPENLMLLIGSKLPGGTRRTISAVSDQDEQAR